MKSLGTIVGRLMLGMEPRSNQMGNAGLNMTMTFRLSFVAATVLFMVGCGSGTQVEPTANNQVDNELVAELAALVAEDQEAQKIAIATRGSEDRAEAFKKKDAIFEKNTDRVREILDEVGFPGFGLVGEEGSHNFWLIVQHADHVPEFQVKVLGLMESQIGNENANEVDFAFLWDRVKKNANQSQKFGTQLSYTDKGQAVPFQIEDSKNVNKRRETIGLAPIEQYLNEMSEMHFEMNKESFRKKGITKYLLYDQSFSTQFLFESPKIDSAKD